MAVRKEELGQLAGASAKVVDDGSLREPKLGAHKIQYSGGVARAAADLVFNRLGKAGESIGGLGLKLQGTEKLHALDRKRLKCI